MKHSTLKQTGFTIVELLIVIVVIGILAAITIVAFNGIQQKAHIAALQSDLKNSSKQLAIDNTINGTYPATASDANSGIGLKASPGTSYQYSYRSSGSSYCLTGTNNSISYYVSSSDSAPKPGQCPPPVLVWTKNTTLGTKDWGTISSSADGSHLVAGVDFDYLYISTDYGATWTPSTGNGTHRWYSSASSADGTKLVAADDVEYIYTSTNSGTSWISRPAAGARHWNGLASSADGTKLMAGDTTPGNVWLSSDSGVSWTAQTSIGAGSWLALASSADGTKLVAASYGGFIYTSANAGASWTQQTAAGSRNWLRVVSSADGTKIAAADDWGSIYTSTDSGVTWTERASAGAWNWFGLASSADGTTLIASAGDGGSGGYLEVSTDSGATWTVQQASPGPAEWGDVTVSADGTRFEAISWNGYLYTGYYQ